MSPSPDVSWSLEPGVIALALILAVLYVRRWLQVRAQDGGRGASPWRLASFLGGLALLLVALVSPVDILGEQLLTMHMVQHVILLDFVPILLVLGLSKTLLRPITRRVQSIEHAAGPLGHPVVAVALYVAAMCVWHVPSLYDAAAEQPTIHVLEHMSFGIAGALYWWHLIGPIRSRLGSKASHKVVYMLSTKFFIGLLGIVLIFSPEPLYPYYEAQPHYWGLSPMSDQAVAGMIMALEQSVIMGIALAWLFFKMLGESELEEQRAERYGDAGAPTAP